MEGEWGGVEGGSVKGVYGIIQNTPQLVALGLEKANYLLQILEPQTAVLTGCLQISLIGKLDLMRESNLPQSQ